jgi:hypothetical protein
LRAGAGGLQNISSPTLAVFIGPEGGFSAEEIEAARGAGFQPVTLGRRILRMETAAVVAAALVLYELEVKPAMSHSMGKKHNQLGLVYSQDIQLFSVAVGCPQIGQN